ncbi:hypothetical protein FHG87_010625 [Trinorchestia longiramus]|nr:hypothetical protein FHG87_010625 [Trinorchestia longiramus]
MNCTNPVPEREREKKEKKEKRKKKIERKKRRGRKKERERKKERARGKELGALAGLSAQMGVWEARIKAGSTASFSFMDEHLQTQRNELPVSIKDCIPGHLEILPAELESYSDDTPLHIS